MRPDEVNIGTATRRKLAGNSSGSPTCAAISLPVAVLHFEASYSRITTGITAGRSGRYRLGCPSS
jgi:hypothetical protein